MSDPQSPSKRRQILKPSALLLFVLVISLVINGLQARYISTLLDKNELQSLVAPLTPGTRLQSMNLMKPSGQTATVSFETSVPTLIYVFRPSCIWCKRNMESLKSLEQQTRNRYRLIGLSLTQEGVSEYLQSNQIDFPVFDGLSPSLIKEYRLGGTPETIVISPHGVVEQSWNGAYTGATKISIERFFSVALPATLLN